MRAQEWEHSTGLGNAGDLLSRSALRVAGLWGDLGLLAAWGLGPCVWGGLRWTKAWRWV